MISPAYFDGPGVLTTEAARRSHNPSERSAPMPDTLPSPFPERPHHGTVDEQLEALDRGLLEVNARVSFLVDKFRHVLGDEREPSWPPPDYPPSPKQQRRHGLRLVSSR